MTATMKDKPSKSTEPGDSLDRPGSVKACQWMIAPDWDDCGKPATFYAPGVGMYYCARHSLLACVMTIPIPPNTKVSDGGGL